ncbi:MAG: hypothetical protein RML72_03955, partial [Bacteroidia bacterium]|nr:hypothetical protein [Bacteroidia bacterium]
MPPNSTDVHTLLCVTSPSPPAMPYVCSCHAAALHKIFASTYWLPHPAPSIAIPPLPVLRYKANPLSNPSTPPPASTPHVPSHTPITPPPPHPT